MSISRSQDGDPCQNNNSASSSSAAPEASPSGKVVLTSRNEAVKKMDAKTFASLCF